MKHLVPNFIQTQYQNGRTTGAFQAYTMFIDLSGFTPLTETLMRQGNEGAEQLSRSLNNIFSPMVHLVYQRKGFIPYFAGDAFTAIFPLDQPDFDEQTLIETARQLRDMFTIEGLKKTRFGFFQIGIKIGLSKGEVQWGIIGDQYKSFYFRGDAIDNCAKSEHMASGQEIILDQHLVKGLAEAELPQMEPLEDGYYRLLENEPLSSEPNNTVVNLAPLEREVAKLFLPLSVLDYSEEGEFRNLVSIFISFRNVKDREQFNTFSTIVLNQINNFSGYFKEVDFGDKGGVMVGFFGAPVSFENNMDRALEFIYSVQQEIIPLQQQGHLQIRAGITVGLAFTGIVGGEERCQYAAVGNRVNLAARLMIHSKWGEVLVDEDIRKCRSFHFEHTGDIRYKGIEGNIPTYRLSGRKEDNEVVYSGQMFGRKEELASLIQYAEPIFEDRFSGLVYVYGEAGIGKSRLSYELRQELRKKGNVQWYSCPADQILRKPFNPFIYFLRNHFGQSPENTTLINHQNFENKWQWLMNDLENAEHRNAETILKELQRTKSVIAALLGIFYEDSLWEQLDAKGRYQNTLQALNQLFQAAACRQALVIELEDAHWYDGSSRAFVRDLIPEMQNYPVFILIPSRYSDDGEKPLLVDQEFIERHKLQVEEIDLNILSREALRAFAANRLEGDIHPNFLDALYRATNGNPFYLEQIIDYFKESKLLRLVDNKWNVKDSSIRVSGSINAILMARIDRLSNLVKETVKAAAVIGREFEVPILNEVLKQNEEFVKYNGNATSVLREQIETAEQGQIWRSMNELRYMFKHSLLREAVYDMQLRARLRRLHQLIAEAIEKLYSENLGERYVDLAFHYENAEVKEKTNHYLGKAADYARRNFQNEQALNFYNRLIDNYREENDKMNQVSTLLNKGSVLRHVGRWEECQTVYTEALGLAHQVDDQLLLGRSNNSLGNLLMLKGNYTEAEIYLERAVRFFDLVDDQLGQLKVNGNLGTLNFRQGQYKAAKAFFTKSISLSHDLKHRTANAQIVANLGLTYMNLGKYDEGIKAQKAQLYICQEANDKQGLAFLNTNLGIVYFEQGKYDEALECYEKGLALSEELGNKQLTSIAIGCIGTVYQRKGDYEKAMENFVLDLELCEQLGDKQGMAIAIGLIGELRSIEGEFDVAIQYLERNLALSEELGYQKGIAKAVNTLGDIYAFKGELTKSIAYYDRAIDISRHINNKLVLGYSLVEKGGVLLQLGKVQEVLGTYQEALEIAKEIGQQDLLFESLILSAKVSHLQGRQEDANRILSDLLQNARNKTEIAAVHYELHHVNPEQSVHRKQALSLYESLFETEPKYLFKERIQELKADS